MLMALLGVHIFLLVWGHFVLSSMLMRLRLEAYVSLNVLHCRSQCNS